jgi:hypothetical protein
VNKFLNKNQLKAISYSLTIKTQEKRKKETFPSLSYLKLLITSPKLIDKIFEQKNR